MGYVILQLAASIDGYIARKDDSVDFLNPTMNEELTNSFNKFLDAVKVIIMGRRTYEVMLGFGEIPFRDKKIFVLTKKNLKSKLDNVVFTNKDINEIVDHEDGTVWLFGGSKVIQEFVNRDLIDEFQIHVVPEILGNGIPLFLNSKGIQNLKLISLEKFENSYTVTYKRK